MSMRALLLAVRDHLRAKTPSGTFPTGTVATGPGWPDPWVTVNYDGSPRPIDGDFVVIVHPGGSSCHSTESLDETFEVNVTISIRHGGHAYDTWGDSIVTPLKIQGTEYPGLYAAAETVRASCHVNYNIVDRANAIINSDFANTTNGFEEPLFFAGMGPPELKSGSWWTAKTKKGNEPRAGLSITVRFQPARRTQRIDLQQ